ncbi:MAG TPA: carboxypeptidase-like regulatory domain-containing protein [Gemmatimonadaceae bacterium]|nr:carboxypeptidase-like regulatory domain-containing protein [Gemmatimonadaceae bacterium]
MVIVARTLTSIRRALVALCVLSPFLGAQTDKADTFIGRVSDLAGRPLSDAQVAVTSLGTGLTRTHSTDDRGEYRISFPENAARYVISVKRVGFTPLQRTVVRHSKDAEEIRLDLQFGATPLALSSVEITGSSGGAGPSERAAGARSATGDATVPNPIVDILALKDTLHLSAVQIVALSEISDSLQTRNSTIYRDIRTLLAKSQEAGDVTQMSGTVAMMLEDASNNTQHAIADAEKILRPEQWLVLPASLRAHPETADNSSSDQKQ